MAHASATFLLLMARSRVTVGREDVVVINPALTHRYRLGEISGCGVMQRPFFGWLGYLWLEDGSEVFVYGIQARSPLTNRDPAAGARDLANQLSVAIGCELLEPTRRRRW